MSYKHPHEIFDKWKSDKIYNMHLTNRLSKEILTKVIYAKNITEARRLSQFWLGDQKEYPHEWKILGVSPIEN